MLSSCLIFLDDDGSQSSVLSPSSSDTECFHIRRFQTVNPFQVSTHNKLHRNWHGGTPLRKIISSSSSSSSSSFIACPTCARIIAHLHHLIAACCCAACASFLEIQHHRDRLVGSSSCQRSHQSVTRVWWNRDAAGALWPMQQTIIKNKRFF